MDTRPRGRGVRRRARVALLGAVVIALIVTLVVIVTGVFSSGHRGTPSSSGRKTPGPTCNALASQTSDLTLSFDAEPADCEWDSIQPGFKCANGSVDRSA